LPAPLPAFSQLGQTKPKSSKGSSTPSSTTESDSDSSPVVKRTKPTGEKKQKQPKPAAVGSGPTPMSSIQKAVNAAMEEEKKVSIKMREPQPASASEKGDTLMQYDEPEEKYPVAAPIKPVTTQRSAVAPQPASMFSFHITRQQPTAPLSSFTTSDSTMLPFPSASIPHPTSHVLHSSAPPMPQRTYGMQTSIPPRSLPSTSTPSISNPAPASSSSGLLSDLLQSRSFHALLAEKDAAYELLLSKYQKLQATRSEETANALLLKQAQEVADQAARAQQQMKQYWEEEMGSKQKRIEELTAELEAVKNDEAQRQQQFKSEKERNEQLQAQVSILSQQLCAAQSTIESQKSELVKQAQKDKIIQTYSLLTSMDMSMEENGMARCSMRNDADGRVVEFDLELPSNNEDGPAGESDDAEIGYEPRRIELDGIDFPQWMNEGLVFKRSMAPRLMKIIMSNLYQQSQQDSEGEEEDDH